jgi:CRP-like cAMP-binding protein
MVLRHKAGKLVTEQDKQCIGFHLLIDGTALVQVGDQRRNDLGPGDYFGEIADR